MSVDTKSKRMSALNYGRRGLVLPDNDGTVATADRQQLLGLYSGIATVIVMEEICITFDAVMSSPSIYVFTQTTPAVNVASTNLVAKMDTTTNTKTSVSSTANSRTSLTGGLASGC
tara:strand:+ start:1516 stop:1863 length:348 start_codon:yes stop_codon:yes gene_type:complete